MNPTRRRFLAGLLLARPSVAACGADSDPDTPSTPTSDGPRRRLRSQ